MTLPSLNVKSKDATVAESFFFFGILVAAIGCLRGLQTKTGASAVGESTTSAVVSGIILIVIADGVFSIIYYYLSV